MNRHSGSFEQRLLSYLYNQTKSSKHPTSIDYELNQTIIGFIDSNEVNRLMNQSSFLLYRLNREKIRFDPSIFLLISIIIICMLIGNEWHRRIFIPKLIDDKHSLKTDGLIIAFLLLIFFVILYLLDRYIPFLIREIYLTAFIICSSFMVYLCLNNFYNLLMNTFYPKFKKEIYPWIIFAISFMMIIIWFLYRLTYVGPIMTNMIVVCITIGIIAQMRIGSVMICMMIFGCIFMFEVVLLIVIGDILWSSEEKNFV